MDSKLKSEMKNNIGNHGEYSTRFDTKTVIQRNNEYRFMKECSINLAPPIIMEGLKKYARKLPETTEELTFGLNQGYPKRRKIEHYQDKLIKNNFIQPFNAEHQTIISFKDFCTLKFKPESYKTKHYTTSLKFSKLNPEIVLDFIKQPSVNKLMKLLYLMYAESIHHRIHSNDLTSCEKSRQMSIELKKYLFELCYKKFCELWLHKTASISLLSTKQLKRFIGTLLRHTRSRTSICNMNLKKLILYNGGFTGYPKKPHLVLCINIICSPFTSLLRKSSNMLYMEKKTKTKSFDNANINSIKLYHPGTTKMKGFLEIVNEYKYLTNTKRLSFYQVDDIKHAYEGILQPGQYIDKNDLNICAYENYRFKTNHNISSNDLNTLKNDDFDFHDIESTPESELKLLYNNNIPTIDNYFKADKFPEHKFECDNKVQSRNYFGLKYDKKNGSIETIETEVHIQSTSNKDHNIDMDISTNDLEGTTATNNAGAETFKSLELERATNTLKKERNNTPKSALKLVLYNIPTPRIDNYFKADKLLEHTLECVSDVQAIVNQDMDISTGGLKGTSATNYSCAVTFKSLELEGAKNTLVKKRNSLNNYSKISERLNKSLLHPIQLTKSEKRMLLTIICSDDMNPFKIIWKRQNPSKRTQLCQVIVYFGSLKMSLCDKLHLNHLDLKDKNICDIIDIEKLLKSVQVESCASQECFTFTEVENFLIWPLGKMIVNNIISQRSPSINILFSFVINIITKFCEKVQDICCKSSQRIILNEESLFESLSNVQIRKDALNTKLSQKYTNVYTHPLPIDIDKFSNYEPGTSNSDHVCVTYTEFCVKKNSLNEEICKSTVNILKSDNFIHQSWKECKNTHRFISKLLKAGVTLPIKENNTGQGSKFVEVYVKWFCEEYLQDDKFYKLAISIFKNIFLYINTASGCTDIKVEDAINNALMILYDQPCFAKAYESYLNTKFPKCLSSSKHNSTNDTKNHSDYKGVNIRAIEEMQIEPNVNVQTDSIDTNNVDISLVPSNAPTSDVFDVLNNGTIKTVDTPDPQSTNYDINGDFFENLLSENSNDLMENIDGINSNNMFDTDNSMIIDDHEFSNPDFNEFNEDSPFDDAVSRKDISLDLGLSDNTIEPPLENNKETYVDHYDVDGMSKEEFKLQDQNAKIEEVSMMSSEQIVTFDKKDEINPNELKKIVDQQHGFYNAGILLLS